MGDAAEGGKCEMRKPDPRDNQGSSLQFWGNKSFEGEYLNFYKQ